MMNITRSVVSGRRVMAGLLALLTGVIITQTGCGQAAGGTAPVQAGVEPVSRQSFYFDTVCSITIYDMVNMSEENAVNAITQIYDRCQEYENRFSKTVEGSDIWNINHAEGEAVAVDQTTMNLIKLGVQYGDLTDGLFDITIGKAEDLWDFHAENPEVPDADELAEAVRHVDYRNIVIDEDAQTIRLADPEAEIDLGGIAKGYIADRIHEQMSTLGVYSAIISLGGNIETYEGKPAETVTTEAASVSGYQGVEQQPFVVGIETPYSGGSAVVGSVQVTDGTVVTSGVYERYFTVGDQEYHHILDPKTGYPADTDVLGVSIVGMSGFSADCDAISTTCLLLGSEAGKSFIESQPGFEAVFITRDNDTVLTSGMEFDPLD